MKTLGLCIAAGLSLSACVTINAPMSSNGSENIVTQYPVETAMLNIYTKQRSEQLVAIVDNQSISADIQVTPKGSMRFNNKTVQGAEVNAINRVNNQITDQSVAINYFTVNPLVFHGFTDSTGLYSLSTQTATIPKIAKVGDFSKLITENVYADSSMNNKIATYNQEWSLARDTNNTAWFCIETSGNLLPSINTLSSDVKSTSSECYKINANGDILASKVTLIQPSTNGTKTVTFVSQ